jgi:hypothetical protein
MTIKKCYFSNTQNLLMNMRFVKADLLVLPSFIPTIYTHHCEHIF